ncbi:MAG: response regulator [Bacteroidetes bacterium]|jgi:DNA-binding NtrC family response regulator|nr:response regulator [Bacteroidota bacterium]
MPHDPSARILVVEDEVIVAMEIEDRLRNLGYEVLDAVTTGEAALDRADALQPDLVLMDIMLDGALDGIETAERLHETMRVPVIFLTAYSDDATLERAKATTPFGYIVKPFEERELYASIEVALRTHAMQQRIEAQRDDLLHILNGLRQGTAMTDANGRLTFLSDTARRLMDAGDEAIGRPWPDVFPVPDAVFDALHAAIDAAPAEREPIPARINHSNDTHYHLEIEVLDDPREPARRIFVLYDVTEVHALRRRLGDDDSFRGMVGTSAAMQQVFQQIEHVARVDTTALIQGETGTGKELAAQAIHDASARADGPFVTVNCAALNQELAGSQLFGHKKGAFTGAVSDEEGYFEAADGGTLFLDEIGDVPLDVQRQLLRVLEERTVTRLGETQSRPVDVRIVAATHRDLRAEVDADRFREDLLYRIRIARVALPPLRERRDDIPLLARRFLQKSQATTGKAVEAVSDAAMRRLIEYDWPGNVRELRNAIEYAMIQVRGDVLHADDLPPEIQQAAPAQEDADWPDDEAGRIRAALAHTDGNRKAAAELLGISRATLYRRLDEYDID